MITVLGRQQSKSQMDVNTSFVVICVFQGISHWTRQKSSNLLRDQVRAEKSVLGGHEFPERSRGQLFQFPRFQQYH